jgi:tripartite ATP-independent transporter DctP family solute receptor
MIKHLLKIFVFAVLLSSCGGESSVKTIRLAHGLDQTHPVHKAMVYMSDVLKKKSNGKMIIDIYSSQQLGSERQCLELLQIGSLDMTKVSAAALEGFAPQYKALGMPYVFKSREHRYGFFDSQLGKEVLTSGTDKWLRGLVFYEAGSRSFYTKEKPVKVPADLGGQKIRVMKSQTAVQMVNSLGGSPTPISWGELYTALQSGVVDGAENNPPSFYLSRHYEICKYYSLDEHTSVPDVLLISTHLWDTFNDEEKRMISEAAQESSIHQRTLWEASEKECLDAVIEKGVTVTTVEKEPFQEKVQKMYEEYKDQPKIYSLIQKIKDL